MTAWALAAVCSGDSISISSINSRASQESSMSTSDTSMCCAMLQASSIDSSPLSVVSSAFSKNSAAAAFPRARSSCAICRAPRSFSKNSRRVSFTRRSASALRAGLSKTASIISGARINRCWFSVISSINPAFGVARASNAIASSGVFTLAAIASCISLPADASDAK